MAIVLFGQTMDLISGGVGLAIGFLIGVLITGWILKREKKVKNLIELNSRIKEAYKGLETAALVFRDINDMIYEADKEVRKKK